MIIYHASITKNIENFCLSEFISRKEFIEALGRLAHMLNLNKWDKQYVVFKLLLNKGRFNRIVKKLITFTYKI